MQSFYLNQNQIWDNTYYWKENSERDYCETVKNMIISNPFKDHKFYIYQFVKRVDDVSGVKKWYHQPRLTKPEPLPGTTLLRVDPKDPDTVTIIWTLPNEENFGLYSEGKMFEDSFVYDCVQKYLHSPRDLMKKEEGDLSDEQIREVYKSIKADCLRKKNAKNREKNG